jgi:predicted metalloprotease with PDZ domain
MTHQGQLYSAKAVEARPIAPLVYTINISDPAAQYVDITLEVPTHGRSHIDLMMPRWSPGFYRVEAYAEQVHDLSAHTLEGITLTIERAALQRWRIHSLDGIATIRVTYRLVCSASTVTTNWIDADFALLNGPATFISPVDMLRHPHEVVLQFPTHWSHVCTGLPAKRGAQSNCYYASDFDTLVDAPILIGTPDVSSFVVDNRRHDVIAVGDRTDWDSARAVQDLEQFVRANCYFWQGLPYHYYVFLLVCREGGGGLEHGTSTLVTAQPSRLATSEGYGALLQLLSHEFFHAFNVKRLRPCELGPFDYEHPPRTVSLWVAEGLTCYYTDLLLCRAGLRTLEWLLAALSEKIALLQAAPGRLLQTLEQSSSEVWDNSFSGLNPAESSVSYYIKGHVVGWLLDAHIRRLTGDASSLDDVMRLAYTRYSGSRGFRSDEFRETIEEVAGTSIAAWLDAAVASTAELDYAPALAWFGLRFAPANGERAEAAWRLQVDETASQEHSRRQAWATVATSTQ